jgi:hypothetical protein
MVIYPQNTSLTGCRFQNASEEMLFEVPEGSTKVGIVGVINCNFTDCQIAAVGIAGTPDQLAHIRTALG